MSTPTNLLLPALLFSVIGIVIGVVATLLIVDRTRAKNEEKSSTEPPISTQETAPTLPADRFDNVGRLFRERTSGKLVVEVDKKVYPTRESAPAGVLHELQTTAESLTAWLGKDATPVQPPARIEAPIQPEPAATLISPTPAMPAASEPPRPTSIVGQINDILQEILLDSELADHKVSLTQEPSMGVVVWVDGVKYPSIDEVQDPEFRDLIKKAVKTWERKNDISCRYP